MKTKNLIVGGGLSGLYAAYRLEQLGEDYQLLEARDRLGGRILGMAYPDEARNVAYDLGPAWIWPDFQNLMAGLIKELGLSVFAQPSSGEMLHETANDQPPLRVPGPSGMRGSYRIVGGVGALIDALATQIPMQRIHLCTSVKKIVEKAGSVLVYTDHNSLKDIEAQRVIMALPPRLIARGIRFEPALPQSLQQTFIETGTWMAGHAKVVALYSNAFWRASGLSGSAFSRRGPMTEIHDASPADGGPYALFGFVGYPPEARRSMGRDVLVESARQQLERMFGSEAAAPLQIFYKDWAQDSRTATEDDAAPLHHHPEYGMPAAARGLWSGRLKFASTEMARQHGGYLEGALEAALEIVNTQ